MVKLEKHCKMEEVDRAMPTTYWMRTHKPTVDYLRDTPFALDRQLEDQKYLQQLNRNPQLNVPTKVDKTRSQHIQAPKGDARAVAMKANALNKFVREATGIHNYTIVAPPRAVTNENGLFNEPLDPETNPRVRSYAAEAKLKPVLCSFGHRPRSASRTFHPATMKLRLPHGAVAPVMDARKSTVGLPVAVLKKIVKAPPIVNVLEEAKRASAQNSPSGSPLPSKPSSPLLQQPLYNDLFLSKAEQDSLFAPSQLAGNMSSRSLGSGRHKPHSVRNGSQASWVSGASESAGIANHNGEGDRPAWNEGFHRIELPSNHVFQLRASGLRTKSKAPLGDLMKRYSSLAVAENQLHPFCTEKQEMDKIARSGVLPPVPKSVPVKGQPLYFDPLDACVADLQKHRRRVEKEKERQRKAKEIREAWKTVPKVDYHPALATRDSDKGDTGESGNVDERNEDIVLFEMGHS